MGTQKVESPILKPERIQEIATKYGVDIDDQDVTQYQLCQIIVYLEDKIKSMPEKG